MFYTLLTLYDPAHLFDNEQHNWITENTRTLAFLDSKTNKVFTVKWKDLMDIYISELKSNAKGTKLNLTTRFPNKSCMEDTLKFVRHVTQVWNMLNIWSCYRGSCLNDPDREPFKSCNDSRLDFVLQWHKRSGR